MIMNGACCSGAPALPVDVVGKVLLLIDQKQRMQSCALVNHDWNTAANLTISKLTCRLGEAAQYEALSRWLQSNSSQIRTIEVCSKLSGSPLDTSKMSMLHLPVFGLQQLQTLSLEYCHLQPMTTTTAPSGSQVHKTTRSSLAALTALRTLKLKDCEIDIDDLGSCTHLQHLQLCAALPGNVSNGSTTAAVIDVTSEALKAALTAALPQLQHLTFLSLDRTNNRDMEWLRLNLFSTALASLQQLQVLEIGAVAKLPGSSLAHLPTSLRKLKLSSFGRFHKPAVSPKAAPQLRRLTNLQHLHLHSLYLVDPVLLISCTQLTGLELTWVDIHSGNSDAEGDEAMMNLLEILGNVQQLQHLNLSGTLEHFLHHCEPYAALTASSHLTSLDISSCCMFPEALESIFAAAQPCRGLLKASLTSHLFEREGSYQWLVSCCPALQCLHITLPFCMDICETDLQSISALQALAALTTLSLEGVQLLDDAVASIAQCQQLKDLAFAVSDVSLDGLAHLTRLTGLTRLSFKGQGSFQPEGSRQLQGMCLNILAAGGCAPDVHQQLKSYLEQQQQKQQPAAPLKASSEPISIPC